MKTVSLRPWSYCYTGQKIVGFMRMCYDIKPGLFENYRLDTIKGYDIIIQIDPHFDKWLVTLPFGIYETFTNTPESLMFKVDLLLLENKLLKDVKYNVEEPFIFPMNDL